MAVTSLNLSSLPAIIGPGFESFIKLSSKHKDSWGLAIDSGGQTVTSHEVAPAFQSLKFSHLISDQMGYGGLLHFRWASPGLAIQPENAHPFTYEDFSFIHNGAISPYDALEGLIPDRLLLKRQGSTDSELLFYFLINKVEELGFSEGVLLALRSIIKGYQYSSLNLMIMNQKELIVVSEYDPENKPDWAPDGYYEIRYRSENSSFAIASSGWLQDGWELLPNHHMLIVNRENLSYEIQPL